MLSHAKRPADIVVCSFAMAEGWIRRLDRLKETGKIRKITVVLDYAVMTRHRQKVIMLENVADHIYFNDTHAKMLLVESDDFTAAAVMSANATMNYRIEAFYVTNRLDEIQSLKNDLIKVYGNSRTIRTN